MPLLLLVALWGLLPFTGLALGAAEARALALRTMAGTVWTLADFLDAAAADFRRWWWMACWEISSGGRSEDGEVRSLRFRFDDDVTK